MSFGLTADIGRISRGYCSWLVCVWEAFRGPLWMLGTALPSKDLPGFYDTRWPLGGSDTEKKCSGVYGCRAPSFGTAHIHNLTKAPCKGEKAVKAHVRVQSQAQLEAPVPQHFLLGRILKPDPRVG